MNTRLRIGRRGATLTELMVAVVILSIGILGLFGAFRYIARSTLVSRAQSMATNLAQERIESLKNLNYYALLLTETSATIPGITPNLLYDTVNYTPETIAIGGITFTRYTYVSMAEMSGSDINEISANYPDTGLKQITVHVVWTDQGVVKKWSLRNLLENPSINPLDSTLSGTVLNSAGGTVASAIVVVEQNEDWGAMTASDGTYSFSVYHGSYTLRASSAGYNDGISATQAANKGGTTVVTPALTLTATATGYIQGIVWYNPDLVISQVVAATFTIVGDGTTQNVEYVELYNPTTYPINVGTTGGFPKQVALRYRGEFAVNDTEEAGFNFTHISTYIAPGRYYLYANATSFYILGAEVIADAYYNTLYSNKIVDNDAGAIQIYKQSTNQTIDTLCWNDNSGGCPVFEGTPIPDPTTAGQDGLGTPPGKQMVRVSSPGINAAGIADFGRAYDSDSNIRDFLYISTPANFAYPPKTMASGDFLTLTGKVSSNVYVSSNDPNSTSTITYIAYITSGTLSLPYAKFRLSGVSTGTWNVAAAYGAYAAFIDTVVVIQGGYTSIPNAVTVSSWPAANLHHMQLSSSTLSGFIKGVVTNNSNAPIANITLQAGGSTKVTGTNGVYFMAMSSGTVTLVANPNNANAGYVQEIQTLVVSEGAVTTQDFTLAPGGRITGYVTTGTTPLAFAPIAVINGLGSQSGSGITDAAGMFTIRNVSTGTYTVFPVLESGQEVTPNTLPAILTATGSVDVGTFTVSGAFGNIAGAVTDASGLVTSGALLIASTSTIASSPAAIVGSSAPAQSPIYMASSRADGTYVLPVRGGFTYNLSVYVPVISGSGSVSVTTKTYGAIVVTPSVTTTKNVAIP